MSRESIIFIHNLSWKAKAKEQKFLNGLKLCKVEENSHVMQLYIDECINRGFDLGEPQDYSTMIHVSSDSGIPPYDNHPMYHHNNLINLLALYFKTPIGSAVCIELDDSLTKVLGTVELFHYSGSKSDYLHFGEVDDRSLEDLAIIDRNINEIWKTRKYEGRIANALIFFHESWNFYYPEKTFINLSIMCEILFAPHSQSETTHQIAYNFSSFYGKNKEEKISVYKSIKKYYGVRSKIVHGDSMGDNDYSYVTEMFNLVASCFVKILLDQELIRIFNEDSKRRKYLEDLIFK